MQLRSVGGYLRPAKQTGSRLLAGVNDRKGHLYTLRRRHFGHNRHLLEVDLGHRAGDLAAMRGYSPYQNIRNAEYPAFFISAGLDDQVVPWRQALKFTARLRNSTPGSPLIVLRLGAAAGHEGARFNWERISDEAEKQAFILSILESRGD